jgi:hypothetical protein
MHWRKEKTSREISSGALGQSPGSHSANTRAGSISVPSFEAGQLPQSLLAIFEAASQTFRFVYLLCFGLLVAAVFLSPFLYLASLIVAP